MTTSVPWWNDPALRLALATVVLPGVYRLLAAAGVKLPLSQEAMTAFFVDGLMIVGGVIWMIRRVKRGQDPNDPTPRITIT